MFFCGLQLNGFGDEDFKMIVLAFIKPFERLGISSSFGNCTSLLPSLLLLVNTKISPMADIRVIAVITRKIGTAVVATQAGSVNDVSGLTDANVNLAVD